MQIEKVISVNSFVIFNKMNFILIVIFTLSFGTSTLAAPKPTPTPSKAPADGHPEVKTDEINVDNDPVWDQNQHVVTLQHRDMTTMMLNSNLHKSTGLFYDAYLQEVVKLLESNEDFKNKMQTADFDDIKSGKLSHEVNFMPKEIRNKLNDLKKQEISRLRKIVQAKSDLENGRKVRKSQHLTQIANHLDHNNPHSFEASDLTNLIKAATSDLENYDEKRHEDFKKYEMKKEMQREEKMKKLNELDRQRAKEEYHKQQQELAKKSAIHHPGSKAQLEEVWKEEDGLSEQDFDPRTFFNLHDLNGDGYLDAIEMESLFDKDLNSIYNSSDPDFDLIQMEEERRRMREHVMSEVDTDKDKLVSLTEFLAYTKSSEFVEPDEDSYKTIDQLLLEHTLFTKDELDRYRSSIEDQEAEIKRKLELLKQEAKNLGGLRRELSDEKRTAAENGLEEHEKINIEIKEAAVKEQEQKLQSLHKDLQEQSKEVLQMKQEVQKHEAGEKIAGQIKEKLDNLPPGEEKDKAVEQAHKELDSLRKIQGMGPEPNPDSSNTDLPPPAPKDDHKVI